MQKGIKNQKGITLVALVITIIVMLILVAVSVTVAINGGLFTKAKEAGNAWEEKSAQEAAGNIVNVDGTITTIDGAIESLKERPTTQTPGTEATTITFYINDTEYTTQATTWGQWLATNTSVGLRINDEGVVYRDQGYFKDSSDQPVNQTDSIVNGEVYSMGDY